jgi:hypothetical protein
MGAVRPGTPSFAIRTAAAPPALALRAFSNMKHFPRRRSATAPGRKPAKSELSQPLEGESRSTGTTWAVTVPLPE